MSSIFNEQASKAERHKEDKLPGQNRDITDGAEEAGRPVGGYRETLHELAAELGETCYQLGRSESRLELTVQAKIILRSALQRERVRADKAERRAEDASSPRLWRPPVEWYPTLRSPHSDVGGFTVLLRALGGRTTLG